MNRFRITSEVAVARTAFITTAELTVATPDGGEVTRVVVRHPGAVAAVVWDGSVVVLVRQYRSAVDAYLLEIPAGKLDESDGSGIAAIEREVREELGYTVRDVSHIAGFYTAPGFTDEYIDVFEMTAVSQVGLEPDGAEEQHAEIVKLSLADALALIDSGDIEDAKTIIALHSVRDRK
ncbi:MAG: NUDIX hydrolase [Acidobacteria bacterium]|nr:NUDIX hydrolase [Acidobacteriota bacterium]MCH8985749.1 NUDIX hydrolase [Acidobacteriota bacterium]